MPSTWQPITDNLARMMSWSKPVYPKPGDPMPFAGSPAGRAAADGAQRAVQPPSTARTWPVT